MGRARTSARQSPVAVDPVRGGRRTADIDSAQKSRPSSLLAVAGGVDEVSSALLAVGRDGKPPGMVARFYWVQGRVVFRDGTGQPAVHAADGGDDSSCAGFRRLDSSLSGGSGGDVAVW